MFEKEAEEILNNHCDCELLSECMTGIRCRCSDFEESKKLLIEGIEFGYNKANEWHYVKDGDYPKDNKPVLCILGDIDSDNCEVGYYNDVGSGEPWHFETYHLPDDDGDNAWGVIAWQEIVLPELKE